VGGELIEKGSKKKAALLGVLLQGGNGLKERGKWKEYGGHPKIGDSSLRTYSITTKLGKPEIPAFGRIGVRRN